MRGLNWKYINQWGTKAKTKRKKPISPKKNKRADGRIERRGKGRDTLLFNILFQRTGGENQKQANT